MPLAWEPDLARKPNLRWPFWIGMSVFLDHLLDTRFLAATDFAVQRGLALAGLANCQFWFDWLRTSESFDTEGQDSDKNIYTLLFGNSNELVIFTYARLLVEFPCS
jgi:hypothetical protein